MSEVLQQIRQVHNQALAELADMKRTSSHLDDRLDDYQSGYIEGYEDATEMYENLVDDIAKILRDADIDSVMTSNPTISDKQYALPIKFENEQGK